MTTRELLRAAEICDEVERIYVGSPVGNMVPLCEIRDRIRALAAQEQKPEGWMAIDDPHLEIDSAANRLYWKNSYLYVRRWDGAWFKIKFDPCPLPSPVPAPPPERSPSQPAGGVPDKLRPLLTAAVEAQRNDKRTDDEKISDGVKFIMGDEYPQPAVPPAALPAEPHIIYCWRNFPTMYKDVVKHVDALRSHTEVLQREIKYLRACISGKGGYIEVMTARDDELAALRPVVEAAKEIQEREGWVRVERMSPGCGGPGNRLASALAALDNKE